jgi:hypothetical protein
MAGKKIEAWEAEVDNGSATPTPPKKSAPNPMGMAAIKPKAPTVIEPVEEIPSEIKDKLQTMKNQRAAEDFEKRKAQANADAVKGVKTGIHNKAGGCVKMAKGGSASARADGCATKGKTKGRMV